MILTDTHTHLYSEVFNGDRDAVISRAIAAGITRFFIPAIDSTYMPAMFQLEKEYPDHIFLMAGLHPTHVKENYREELAFVENLLQQRTFCGIGETGMDLYWDTTFLKEQQDAFASQIRLAKAHKLPLIIHCREAFDPIFEVLETEKSEELFGIFHCFTGTLAQAQRAISYQMKLGIGGVVTFKNGKIDTFLPEIDLKHLVLETDAPYLAPLPYRGKRNESAYLMYVAAKVAALYQKTPQEIAAITTQNAREVFKV